MEGITQTATLFMVGMLIGRTGLFLNSEKNNRYWVKVFIISTLSFFPIYGLIDILPDFINREAKLVPYALILKSIPNLAYAGILFSGVIL